MNTVRDDTTGRMRPVTKNTHHAKRPERLPNVERLMNEFNKFENPKLVCDALLALAGQPVVHQTADVKQKREIISVRSTPCSAKPKALATLKAVS